ncbi:(+)-neomenthol dehydrogenase-like [Gossypium australe]|uniref:(+)-neomenthol dehydrogenase-like n=1 Tax=Gossypium australe TaxID=47621 RepID=A0A5B6WV13_9ROSI|nr:(+)-neomenthol dehydrogenase-like [Gossypium australe]
MLLFSGENGFDYRKAWFLMLALCRGCQLKSLVIILDNPFWLLSYMEALIVVNKCNFRGPCKELFLWTSLYGWRFVISTLFFTLEKNEEDEH